MKELGLDRSLKSLHQLKPACPLNCTLNEVHKTGLGSSAALVTSIVAAIMAFTGVISSVSITDEDKRHIHNVAQFCHCLAQGKIGSGFDVSSAVYGSHMYRRFAPAFLDPVMLKDNVSMLLFKLYI